MFPQTQARFTMLHLFKFPRVRKWFVCVTFSFVAVFECFFQPPKWREIDSLNFEAISAIGVECAVRSSNHINMECISLAALILGNS
jgi:hypothetical protein